MLACKVYGEHVYRWVDEISYFLFNSFLHENRFICSRVSHYHMLAHTPIISDRILLVDVFKFTSITVARAIEQLNSRDSSLLQL
jgi:hypothetical protein